MDRVLGNKLVSRAFLEVLGFEFTGHSANDVERLYRAASFGVVDAAVVMHRASRSCLRAPSARRTAARREA